MRFLRDQGEMAILAWWQGSLSLVLLCWAARSAGPDRGGSGGVLGDRNVPPPFLRFRVIKGGGDKYFFDFDPDYCFSCGGNVASWGRSESYPYIISQWLCGFA